MCQREINKFGIYFIDLENLSKKGKESENKGKNFQLCQDSTRLLIPAWDGILHMLMLLKEPRLGWYKKIATKTLKDLDVLKTIRNNDKVPELAYTTTLL